MRRKLAVLTVATAVLGAGLTGATGTGGAAPSAQAAVGNGRIDVWNWNITGAGSDPDGVNNGGNEVALTPLKNQLNALSAGARPDVITLQEVCENQRAHAQPYLESLGYTVNFRQTRSQLRCDDRAPGAPTFMGDLVAVPSAYAPTAHDYDKNAGDGLTCLLFTKSRTVIACSAQVSGGAEDVKASTTYRMLRDEIIPWTGFGWGVVIAGDFNTSPQNSPMDNMYDDSVTGARGRLLEADMSCATCRDGRWTHDSRGGLGLRKIDYVFYSKNVFARTTFQAELDLKEQYSYHRFYKAGSAFK